MILNKTVLGYALPVQQTTETVLWYQNVVLLVAEEEWRLGLGEILLAVLVKTNCGPHVLEEGISCPGDQKVQGSCLARQSQSLQTRKEMFYLTTHFISGYMVLEIWNWTIQIATCCCQYTDYSFWLAAQDLLYVTTHFIYGYVVSESKRGNLLLPNHWPLFPISSKGSFMYTILQTG